MRELEHYEPTGDTDLDTAWRGGIQTRFAANAKQLRIKTLQITDIVRQQAKEAPPDVDLIDDLPLADIDVTQLPEELQRQLYDAFHLEIRYDHCNNALNLRITLDAETVPALANAVTEILDLPRQRTAAENEEPGVGSPTAPTPGEEGWDVLRVLGRIRTCDKEGSDLAEPGADVVSETGPHPLLPRQELAGDLREHATKVGLDSDDRDGVVNLAAVAMTRLAWRDGPVEDWHRSVPSRIGDGEMMRANAATTRLVRSILNRDLLVASGAAERWNPLGGAADTLVAVHDAVVDPGRHVPDGRSWAYLAPDHRQLAAFTNHADIYFERWTELVAGLGLRDALVLLACYGGMYNGRWWLAPRWPRIVDEFVRRVDDPTRWGSQFVVTDVRNLARPKDVADSDQLHRLLLDGPDRLSAAAAAYCVRVGLGRLFPEHCGLPPVPRSLIPSGVLRLVDTLAPIHPQQRLRLAAWHRQTGQK